MAETTKPAAKAAKVPSSADIERAREFAREPFLLEGEKPSDLAPGTPRRRALDAALTEIEEGNEAPSIEWCLIIVRLPFSPPDEPVTAAKCQLLEKQGRNAFSAYSLPEALLRFRQGFGRLIRTPEDRGVLVVLDRRIITAKYGLEFQKSIPTVDWHQASINEMVEMIEEWI